MVTKKSTKKSEKTAAKKTKKTAETKEEKQQTENEASKEDQELDTSSSKTPRRQHKKVNSDEKTETVDISDKDKKEDKKEDKKSKDDKSKNSSKKDSDKKDDKSDSDKSKEEEKKEPAPSENEDSLKQLTHDELIAKADELHIPAEDVDGLKKAELVHVVAKAIAESEGFKKVHGILDIMQDGYGFIRCKDYMPSELDVYIPVSMVRKNGLRKGDELVGETRPPREGEKYAAMANIISVNDVPIEKLERRPRFADLTPIFPDDRLVMEHGAKTTTARVIDLVAPIGKGQRGLIVSPPKAGKTTILKDIAHSISANNPEVHLMCLLVDERPEEVTDMERSINGEVISSTFDMPCENHIAIAELTIERAKRLVEHGRDVVILLDSITRLARAYNLGQPASGRVLSGGVDSTALYPPKRFLGAARNIEGGGSLTILASALIDTGSKMDEVIFEEFKGTGNMELKLDRSLADRRIFPAIDPITSGTRKEDLLLDPQEAPLIWAVRRILANVNSTERAMTMLVKSIKATESNQEFLIRTAKKATKSNDIETVKGL